MTIRKLFFAIAHKHQKNDSCYVLSAQDQWSVNDFATKKELTLAGLGWGRLPKNLIETALKDGTLTAINVESIPTHTDISLYMFRDRNREHGPVANHFWQELQAD